MSKTVAEHEAEIQRYYWSLMYSAQASIMNTLAAICLQLSKEEPEFHRLAESLESQAKGMSKMASHLR